MKGRAMTASHECPVRGCPQRVTLHMLMCRPHWYQVPRPLRGAVWDAWQAGEGAGSAAHCEAIEAAVEAVNARQGAWS